MRRRGLTLLVLAVIVTAARVAVALAASPRQKTSRHQKRARTAARSVANASLGSPPPVIPANTLPLRVWTNTKRTVTGDIAWPTIVE